MNSVGGGVATADRRSTNHQINFALPGSQSTTTTIINESEFPSLGVRSEPFIHLHSWKRILTVPTTSGGGNTFSTTNQQSPLPPYKDQTNHRANYATLMRGVDASLNNPEFQIQNEDFPALPGAPPGDHPAPTPASLMTAANDMPMSSNATSSGDPFARPSGETARGIITHPDGEVSNIPPTMLADQFGMAGLVTYLRTVDNPSIVSLALGYDLTTLGLNLNLSERHLYTSFGGLGPTTRFDRTNWT
ncbi:CCR4-NOT transcription complex subunit 2 [Parelaphostrongylus tenuis]|uniref:CCR4-NOT transcription complex subunit 2 n=1 Tax=Parelaphostrongylus tenuis TaxID=148309 RepID=A0AAD5LW46_PARTN|nr:CCR4-NOT transcription complex subunit 2 [Parelaphostrongylus tenuis]